MKFFYAIIAVISFGIVSSQAMANSPSVSRLKPAKHDISWYLSNGYFIKTDATTASQYHINFLLESVNDQNVKFVLCDVKSYSDHESSCYAVTKEND